MRDVVEILRSLSRYEHDDMSVGDEAADEITRLRSDLSVAREALEFYANPEIYKSHPHGLAFDKRDLSERARTTLNRINGEPT